MTRAQHLRFKRLDIARDHVRWLREQWNCTAADALEGLGRPRRQRVGWGHVYAAVYAELRKLEERP